MKRGVSVGLAMAMTLAMQVPAGAQSRLLRCKVEDARENVSGQLENTSIGNISIGAEMLFDEASNVLMMPGGFRWYFDLLQPASAENDLIAVRNERGPASVSQMVFRLRGWEADLPFLFVFGWEVQTGRCKPF